MVSYVLPKDSAFAIPDEFSRRSKLETNSLKIGATQIYWREEDGLLSYCNLAEWRITHTDEGFNLSSLLALNLSRNNFSIVYPNISQISKHFRILKMSHCKFVQEIPELPSKSAGNRDSQQCIIVAVAEADPVIALPPELLQIKSPGFIPGSQYDGKGITLLIDGSVGVPEWIKHQNMGNEIVMELPLNWYEDHNLLGVSFFSLHVPLNGSEDPSPRSSSTLKCELAFHGEQSGIVDNLFWDSLCECHKNGGAAQQVWVTNYPKIAMKEMYHSNSYRFLKASFRGKSMKVEKCGMDLIYAGDYGLDPSTTLGNLSHGRGSTTEGNLHPIKRRLY